jgi:hypothetical protein
MRIRWVYYMLLDRENHVVGYLRTAAGRRQYADLRDQAWRPEPIGHADTVRIAAPIGLRYLKGE